MQQHAQEVIDKLGGKGKVFTSEAELDAEGKNALADASTHRATSFPGAKIDKKIGTAKGSGKNISISCDYRKKKTLWYALKIDNIMVFLTHNAWRFEKVLLILYRNS